MNKELEPFCDYSEVNIYFTLVSLAIVYFTH